MPLYNDDFDDEPTQVSASAPLVAYGNTPAEVLADRTTPSAHRHSGEPTGVTKETDMSTMPETRSAAREVLAREVESRRDVAFDQERERGKVRDFSMRYARSARVAAPEHLVGWDRPITLSPRRLEESRSLASTGNMKAGLTSSRPKLTLMPARAVLHTVRPLEYGADFYRRGNYHGPAPIDPATGQRIPDEVAIMGYLDAVLRHISRVTNAFQHAHGVGDTAGARAAIGHVDDVAVGKPPSGLPDLGHAMASLAIAIERAVDDGLLPEDPGQPWREGRVTEERSPDVATRLTAETKPVEMSECADCGSPTFAPERECPVKPFEAGMYWRGYRREDALAAMEERWGPMYGPIQIFDGDVFASSWIEGRRAMSVSAGDEAGLRTDQGLRRPDEPDYKPLTLYNAHPSCQSVVTSDSTKLACPNCLGVGRRFAPGSHRSQPCVPCKGSGAWVQVETDHDNRSRGDQ